MSKLNLKGFWEAVADDGVLRAKILKDGTLFSWPSVKRVGIINFKSMDMNCRVLRILVKIWCPQLKEAKTIFPNLAREEVGCV